MFVLCSPSLAINDKIESFKDNTNTVEVKCSWKLWNLLYCDDSFGNSDPSVRCIT